MPDLGIVGLECVILDDLDVCTVTGQDVRAPAGESDTANMVGTIGSEQAEQLGWSVRVSGDSVRFFGERTSI